jgi:hypothetical protein
LSANDPDYDPYLDWVPPAKVYGDEVLVDDSGPDGLGRNQPFWKVLLWHTAKARTEMLRNDSAATGASSLSEEQQAPRLAADEEPIPSEVLRAIEQKIEELAIRLDNYERTKRAEQALLDLEERIEAELPPDTDDDDDMIKMH